MTELLNMELYTFLLIFLRIGGAVMFMPSFNASYINTQFRLCIALSLTVILMPFLNDKLPPLPQNFADIFQILIFEITYGIFIGIFMQILMAAINLAGNLIGQAIGFSNAQMFDPTFQQQSIIVDSFLTFVALTVIFVTDLHHLMLSAVIESYSLFPVGSEFLSNDMAQSVSQTLSKSFVIGFKIGSPFVAFAIVFYVGMGLLSRLMPQLNIFFLSMPLQIYLGAGLLCLTLPVMIVWFIKYYEDGLQLFLR